MTRGAEKTQPGSPPAAPQSSPRDRTLHHVGVGPLASRAEETINIYSFQPRVCGPRSVLPRRTELTAPQGSHAEGPGHAGCRLSHLVRQPRDEHVPAHGRVLVHEAGALLPTLVLPEQARLVNHPAEGDGSWDAPCEERPVSLGHAPGRHGRRAALRSRLCGFSERGPRSSVISGVQGGLQSSLLGGPLRPFVLRRSRLLGKSMTMGPSSGLLGNGVPRSLGKGHLGCTPAR